MIPKNTTTVHPGVDGGEYIAVTYMAGGKAKPAGANSHFAGISRAAFKADGEVVAIDNSGETYATAGVALDSATPAHLMLVTNANGQLIPWDGVTLARVARWLPTPLNSTAAIGDRITVGI